MRLLILSAIAVTLQAAEPIVSAWIMSRPAASSQLRKLLPDVHEVIVEDQYVEVRSAGISLLFLGPFQNPLTGTGGVRDLCYILPRHPVLSSSPAQRIGPGELGVFLNGVPLYNRFAEASYLGRNMWHFDTVAFKDPTHPLTLGVLEPMLSNSGAHSPILGFALDGFPIYGPWGFSDPNIAGGLRRMHSGYRLRHIAERTRWAGGKELTPSQYGPPVGAEFPLGTFAEDYEYRPDPGDLDSSNGRFCITPEYPQGTYAYFLSSTDRAQLAFPYFLFDRFQGALPNQSAPMPHFSHDELVTGRPVELRFKFPDTRALEIVHEQPVHLMIVSADQSSFDHIHPQWKLGDYYAVTHSFTNSGKYRLFAQYTPPGEPEQLETFDIDVAGPEIPTRPAPSPVTAKLRQPAHVQTGQDLAFTVDLTGEPIEPYLGAWAHFVLLDRNNQNFIHAHPEGSAATQPDPRAPHIHGITDAPAGPPPTSIGFTTNFSQPGHYKLWAQFQVAGQPVPVPFEIEVNAAPAAKSPATIPPGAIAVTVDARGYTPARIEARSGHPVILALTRTDAPNCGAQIVFPSLGLKRALPIGQTTLIELPALQSDLAFSCGMGMLRGMIVAVPQ